MNIEVKEILVTDNFMKRQTEVMLCVGFIQRLKFLIFGHRAMFVIDHYKYTKR